MEALPSSGNALPTNTDGPGRPPELRYERHGRYWAVWSGADLLCLTVYRKGARSVIAFMRSLMEAGNGGD